MRVSPSGLPGRTLSPELCPVVAAHPRPPLPPPAPACVNFSNICFPWALVGLGWEGRELLRFPEAAPSPVHPAGCPRPKRPFQSCPGVPAQQSLPQAGQGLCLPFSLGLATAPHPTRQGGLETRGAGALLAPGSLSKAEASTGPLGQDPAVMGRHVSRPWAGAEVSPRPSGHGKAR